MKIFVNIALLLILLALLVLAVTLPRQWTSREETKAALPEKTGFAVEKEPDPASPQLATVELAPEVEAKPEPAPVIEAEPEPERVTPSEILEIVSKLQRGETGEAAILINEVLETLDDRDAIVLQSIVSKETAKAEQLELLESQLEDSKKELAEVEKNSRKALDESLKTLATATKIAEETTADLERQIKEQKEKGNTGKPPQPAPVASTKPVELPGNDLIDFSFGSTYLSEANKETLSKTIKILKDRDELVVQLRGHTDTVGEPQYNAILANARCEMARDFLIENGIKTSRIAIVSFGESQVFKEGVVAEKPRRVEILFREKS